MFNKSKTEHAPPPAPPTLDEMLADIETFKVPNQLPSAKPHNAHDLEDLDAHADKTRDMPLAVWWQQFDLYEAKLKDMVDISSRIRDYEEKLAACKGEIEAETKNLQDEIHTKQLEISANLK